MPVTLPRRADSALFAALLIAGLIATFVLKPPLYSDAHALGMHTIALLVPYVAALVYAVATVLRNRLDRTRLGLAIVLFVLLVLPFADLFTSPIVHFEADDSYRYTLYARNMLSEATLWGSDGLLYGRRYFVDQPGYRYYVAATIALLGGEHRGLQLFNLGVMLAAVLALLRILQARLERRSFLHVAIFLLASAPYAAKNVLYGYAEWLSVSLFTAAAIGLLTRHDLTSIVCLALVPFVRQNLLLVSLAMAGYTVVRSRKWWLVLPYLFVLGLPLYHNRYYAGEWRFFVENTGALVRPTGGLPNDVAAALAAAAARLPHYLGYAPGQKLTTLAVALFFAPLGSALVLHAIVRARRSQRALFAVIAAVTVAPTLVFGSGSFPRFEYVNLSVILLSFAVIGSREGPRDDAHL